MFLGLQSQKGKNFSLWREGEQLALTIIVNPVSQKYFAKAAKYY